MVACHVEPYTILACESASAFRKQEQSTQNGNSMRHRGRLCKSFTPERLEDFLCSGADFTTYEFLIHYCGSKQLLDHGKRVHQHIVDSGHGNDRYLANLLVQMYGKCGSSSEARSVFDQIAERNVFSWTLMISAYAQSGRNAEALHLFQEMDLHGEAADRITFIAMLGVCSCLGDLTHGQTLHTRISASGFDQDTVAATAIFNMYAKCGSIRRARFLFENLPQRSVISWNSMITAYAQEGQHKKALELFRKLDQEGVKADAMTFSALLGGFAITACLPEGRKLHVRLTATGFNTLVIVGNPLVNMYGKCGCLEDARRAFDAMSRKDVVSWNTMVAAYADHGYVAESLDLFHKITVAPDWITFCGVFHACNHAGLVDEACGYLLSMRSRYGIEPRKEHYHCVVDILAKAGKLDEAERLICKMPVEADAAVWRSFLAACKIHGDVERGTRAAMSVIAIEPGESGPYILLANMYAAAGRLDDLDRVRKMMRDRGLAARDNSRRSCGQLECAAMGKLWKQTMRLESRQTREKLQDLNKQMEDFRGGDALF